MMRWLTRIGVGVLLAFMVAGAAAWWWFETEARGPALAAGMRWDRDCCNVESPYDDRLRALFPAGSSERRLQEILVRQGFELKGGRRAVARWSDLVCGYFANVEWEADSEGKVTEVSGDFGSACV